MISVDGHELFPIKGINAFVITKDGRVYSLPRTVSNGKSSRNVDGKWMSICGNGHYPNVRLSDYGKLKTYRIHRLMGMAFLDLKPEMEVDHIDGNPFNNHISNLRIATRSQNCYNQRRERVAGFSGFKGVWFYKYSKRKQWYAGIQVNNKKISLGYYETKEEAAKAYDNAAKKYFGEFASLNYT